MKKIIVFFLLASSLNLIAHEITTLEWRDKNNISIGLEKSRGLFRDFATSPLFYTGLPTGLTIYKNRIKAGSEVSFGGTYTFGNFSNNFNDHSSISAFNSIDGEYSRMYHYHGFQRDKYHFRVGGKLVGNAILRQNPDLRNNGVGIDFFANLMGSFLVGKDISRKTTKEKWFLFKYRLKPRKRNLSLRFNLGLINSHYRNGYAYSGQSALLNEFNLFDDYNFKILSGYRVSTELDYTVYLNSNALKFSYHWEAFSTAQKTDKLDVAFHTLGLHILIAK